MAPNYKLVILSMAPLAAAGFSPAAARDCHKPNIVLVMTDQQTALAMSCAGNPYLDTPNMDRLSAMGVRFENNYCTAPVSGPSRAALFTGYFPDEKGMARNGDRPSRDLEAGSLGNLLSSAGYTCVYGGKWHVGPQLNVPQWSGFERIHPCDDRGLGESAAAWLSQKKNGPFMLVASFENPHNICEWARFQNLPYGNVALPSPEDCPPLPGNFERNSDDADVLLYEQGANYSAYPSVRFTDEDWRNYRYVYYRLVEKVDAEIGQIVKALDDNALWEDSLVIFASDHGDGVGAHHWNQKSALYEEVVNVPLIVVLPGKKHAGQTRVQLVGGGVDLFATICDWAGIAERRDGVSFRKVAEKNAPGQDFVVTETTFDGGQTRGWMLRTPSHKYVLYDKGKCREQLFDMGTDRLERKNLVSDPDSEPVLLHLRSLLRGWFQKHGVRRSREKISDIPE